jgi:hypothetical protein
MTAAQRLDIVSNDAGDLVRREHARDLGANVVVAIYRLTKLAQLHDLGNQAFVRQLEQTLQSIHDYCLRAGTNVNVLFAHKAIFVAGQLLKGSRGAYESAAELGEILAWCGGAELTITREVGVGDLTAFAEAISSALRSGKGTFRSPSPHVRLRPVADSARLRGLEIERLAFEQRVVRTYASAIVIVRRFFEDLEAGRYVLPQRVKRVSQNIVDLSEGSTAAFLGVTEMRNANSDDAGRAVNTAILSVLACRQLTQDRATLAQLAMSAMMYDAGRPRAMAHAQRAGAVGIVRAKLGEDEEDRLPAGTAAVLTAVGRLNEASIRRTVTAYEALWMRRASSLGPPYRGARQPTLHARIVSIARRYNEHMTPDPGLPAPAPDHAIARLHAELTDPADQTVLRMLVSALGIYPIGTVLQLTSGDVVEVTSPGTARPRARVVMDGRGGVVTRPVEIDLAQRPDVQIARVLGTDGWRKGEGATLDKAGESLMPREPSNQRSSSTSGVSGARAVDPSRPSMASSPSMDSGPSFGTSPSQVVEAVLQRATKHPSAMPQSIVETEDGRTILARSPFSEAEKSVVDARGGATAVGNIATTPVVHILVYVLEHGMTGTAEFIEPSGEKHHILFSRGTPTKVKTGRPVAPLAKSLVEMGVLRDSDAAMAVASSKQTGMLLGEYLVKRKMVRPEDLARAFTWQMRSKLASIVNLPPPTTYAFYQDTNLVEDWGGEGVDIEPLGTILAVVRAWHDRVRVRATLQRIAGHAMRVHPESTIDVVDMTEEERASLAVMRRRELTLGELFRVQGLDEESLASLAYTLAVTRHVVLPGQRGGPMAMAVATSASPPPSRIVPTAPPSQPVSQRPSIGGDRTIAEASPFDDETPPRSVMPEPTPPRVSAPPISAQPMSAPPMSAQPMSAPPASARMLPVTAPPQSLPPVLAPATARAQEAQRELKSGETLLGRKDLVNAELAARKAMQLDPDLVDPPAFLEWVLVMAGKKTPAAAIVVLTDLLLRDPACLRARLVRAKLLKRENKLAQAVSDLDEVLRADPEHKEAKNEMQLLKLFARK